jgi:hypothetical protein
MIMRVNSVMAANRANGGMPMVFRAESGVLSDIPKPAELSKNSTAIFTGLGLRRAVLAALASLAAAVSPLAAKAGGEAGVTTNLVTKAAVSSTALPGETNKTILDVMAEAGKKMAVAARAKAVAARDKVKKAIARVEQLRRWLEDGGTNKPPQPQAK